MKKNQDLWHSAGYNPAQHGFVAKIWETLRRNEDFRKDILDYRNRMRATGEAEIPDHPFYKAMSTNPFLMATWLTLKYSSSREAIENQAWPNLVTEARKYFLETESLLRGKVTVIPPPPFDSAGKRESTAEQSAANEWFNRISTYFKHYLVVAIPRRIRDTDHKKEILGALEKAVTSVQSHVPRSLKFRDDLPSGGKLLGTRRDWAIQLFIESHQQRGCTLDEALALAASNYSKDEQGGYYAELAIEDLRTRLVKSDLEQIWRQYGSKVRKHLHPIQHGMRDLYPAFAVLRSTAERKSSTSKK